MDTNPEQEETVAWLAERCCNISTTLMSSFTHNNQDAVNQETRHKAVAELVNCSIKLLQVSFLTTMLSLAKKTELTSDD